MRNRYDNRIIPLYLLPQAYSAVNKSGSTIARTTMIIITEDMIFFVFLLNMEYASPYGTSSDSYRIILVLLKGYYI